VHILFICHEYPPAIHGGIGAFTQTLGRRLVANGHRVTVVGVYRNPPSDESDDRGVRVVRIPSRGPRGLRALVDDRALWGIVRRLVTTEGVDVIDGPEMSFWNTPRTIGAPCSLRMNGGHHFFAAAEGTPTRSVRAHLERRSFRRADHLCAVTHYVADRTRTLLSLRAGSIEVLPNPVDTDQFRPRPDIPAVPGRIVFFGTVCEKKGIEHLIAAFPRIRREIANAHLVVAGRERRESAGRDSLATALRRRLAPETSEHVIFTGAVDHDDVPELLATAEVCVCPSLMESQGIAWCEVMSAGRPLVASALGPGPEVVRHGISGLLADPRDVPALGDLVVRLLGDPSLRDRLGTAARQEALRRFSVEQIARSNERWFESVVQVTSTRLRPERRREVAAHAPTAGS
jgi:glycosyltransferase involved in cell wall biosynthesis